jgi:hypothetical protein
MIERQREKSRETEAKRERERHREPETERGPHLVAGTRADNAGVVDGLVPGAHREGRRAATGAMLVAAQVNELHGATAGLEHAYL